MKNLHHFAGRTFLYVAFFAFGATALVPARAADAPVHVRGTIASVTDSGFTVRTDSGDKTIALAASTKIVGVVPSSLDQIKSGTFIGTANVKRDGNNRALEVVVFPASMKGSGLGDYPWDLAPSGNASAMTNGTVRSSAMTNGTVRSSTMTNATVKSTQTSGGMATHSAMTNGTVKKTSDQNGLSMVVDYGKGEKTINVPSDVPVVALQPADRSALVQGAHVFVVATPGAPMSANSVAVGLHGAVPPM